MEANKILQASLLDIIFEGKNKSYGAYDLRQTYNSRIIKALSFTGVLIVSAVIFSSFAEKRNAVTAPEILIITPGHIPPEPKLPEIKPAAPISARAAAPVAPQQIFVKPVIVVDEMVRPEDRILSLQESLAIGTEDIKKGSAIKIIQAPITDTGTSVAKIVIPEKEVNAEFVPIEKEAEFPGGNAAWRKFLQNNLDANKPVSEGAAPGSYTVLVQFIVNAEGNVSDVKALTNIGFGMEKEAVKAITKGPKWIPALQNGRYVKAYRKQPVTFLVQE